MLKTCSVCGKEKDIDDFYKHPKTIDGVEAKCKECKKLTQRVKYQQPGEKEKRQARYHSNRSEISIKQAERYKLRVERPKKIAISKETQRQYNKNSPPITSVLNQKDFQLVTSLIGSNEIDSISDAMKYIVTQSLKEGLHYNLNAFGYAASYLDANYFQLFHLHNNLRQLYDGYLTGKVPGIKNQATELKDLIDLCSSLITMVKDTKIALTRHLP